ncbi:hypothetical protein G6O67_002798 [Ophiocordyceps sinensis]|uniref:Uncharacterized protein n=1 Tax=Ophiocordyceps sinensis TaxID=72228 RepID=A0A8H4PV04_9HYPO|nr:hypothetical protein G6O67_002798 [Ophiocordyceps sinensis]
MVLIRGDIHNTTMFRGRRRPDHWHGTFAFKDQIHYFFYAGHTISEGRQKALEDLAYATARDVMLTPKMILVRADIHATTTVNGRHVADKRGWHATFAFKDGDQVHNAYHIASHGGWHATFAFQDGDHVHDAYHIASHGSQTAPKGLARDFCV